MTDQAGRSLKIATWNVNSLRVRLPHVLEWLAMAKPDVLALQELKMPDEDFPLAAIQQAGYTAYFSGQRTYNGVALLSREPLTHIIKDIPELIDPQRRIIGATLGNLFILNIYVPNGESVTSEKYQYKLDWLTKLNCFLAAKLKEHPETVILGDFNIAPNDIDVHNPKRWEGQVLFSLPEREAYSRLLELGFQDCYRSLSSEKEYTWWDYRLNAFQRNWGLRIDHILASKALFPHCKQCVIDKALRGQERPSDHAPVLAKFTFS